VLPPRGFWVTEASSGADSFQLTWSLFWSEIRFKEYIGLMTNEFKSLLLEQSAFVCVVYEQNNEYICDEYYTTCHSTRPNLSMIWN